MKTTHDKFNEVQVNARGSKRRDRSRPRRRDWSDYGFMPVPVERSLLATIGRPFA